MGWGFSNALAFAVAMTVRDMSKEREKRLIKTRKFYQECYEKIADDSHQAFNTVMKVVQKASRRYIPDEIASGSTYLALYAFALVIERQGNVTKEQSKIIKLYFDNMNFPFSQSTYLNAAKTGAELNNFRKIMSISRNYAGEFWVQFFRALYKSGTQKDLQDMVDYTTSIIMRFAVLGNPNSNISNGICQELIDSINYQINQAREISPKEVDWLGVIPMPDRLSIIRTLYEDLVDNSNITEDVPKDNLLSWLELLILNCICDIVMMIKQSKSVKLKMINDAVQLVGIHTDVKPEEYVKEITNNTETGKFYKTMFSSDSPMGSLWTVILIMGGQIDKTDEALEIINSIFSIMIQVENYLDETYNFLGKESIAQDYTIHILELLAEKCNEAG